MVSEELYDALQQVSFHTQYHLLLCAVLKLRHKCFVWTGADAEVVLLNLFLADGSNPSVRMETTNFDKRSSVIAMTAVDIFG
jgi:hypothetical protein